MIKILSAEQLRMADEFTISQQRIKSIELMERAAESFVECLLRKAYLPPAPAWFIFCGYGNNGGDALAIARLLKKDGEEINVFYLAEKNEYSEDFQTNFERLKRLKGITPVPISRVEDFPMISRDAVIIDGLFGSGLNRPLIGLPEKLIRYLNEQDALRVAIDIPSGLFSDQLTTGTSFHAFYTISFHAPKLSFLFAENAEAVGYYCVVDIGLSDEVIRSINTSNLLIEEEDVRQRLRRRKKFDHKGNYGHALIHAGSSGKMGAAILCAAACARAGAGLTTAHVPYQQSVSINAALPEVMTREYENAPFDFASMKEISAFAVGPGIGTGNEARKAVMELLKTVRAPMVLDADAINIVASEKKQLALLPPNTILTPHLKEFERLAGKTKTWMERHERQLELSQKHSLYIVLKGAYTCITTPEGFSFFNPTGNPGMAKGGSGDVLTGMIVSFLAQRYSAEDACVLGVYLHGLAADLAVEFESHHSLMASDIIHNIGAAFRKIDDPEGKAQLQHPGDPDPGDYFHDHDILRLN